MRHAILVSLLVAACTSAERPAARDVPTVLAPRPLPTYERRREPAPVEAPRRQWGRSCSTAPEIESVRFQRRSLRVGQQARITVWVGFDGREDLDFVVEPPVGLTVTRESVIDAKTPPENEATVWWRTVTFQMQATLPGRYALRFADECIAEDWWTVRVRG